MGFVFSRLRKKKTRIDQLDEVYQVLDPLSPSVFVIPCHKRDQFRLAVS